MAADEPLTHWLQQLQGGDQQAAQKLWEAYFHRLVGLARRKLQELPRRAAVDEEDVALSAFDSFCRGTERGRFPALNDRVGLWRLLVTITARKSQHLVRDQRRQKRGGGLIRGESALQSPHLDESVQGMAQVLGQEPTPAFAAQVADECRRLLAQLDDPALRDIAIWKMEGDTVPEIAAKLDCAPSTVERRLALIRRIWAKEMPM